MSAQAKRFIGDDLVFGGSDFNIGWDSGVRAGWGGNPSLPDPTSAVYNPYTGQWGNTFDPYEQNRVTQGDFVIQTPIPEPVGPPPTPVRPLPRSTPSATVPGSSGTVSSWLTQPIYGGSSITWGVGIVGALLLWLLLRR